MMICVIFIVIIMIMFMIIMIFKALASKFILLTWFIKG